MLNRVSYLIYLSKHKNYFFKAKAIKKIQANYRWLLQKRSICVYFCHIGKVQKGNKKPRTLDEKTGFKRAGPKGLEPSTSGLTGRRSNQLNYDPKLSSTSGDFPLYINAAGMTMIYPMNNMMGARVRL